MDINQTKQFAITWLKNQGIRPTLLTPLSGYSNFVFRVEQAKPPKRSILRIANADLSAHLCPFAHHPQTIIRMHQQAAELGLAPAILGSDSAQGMLWLADAGKVKTIQTADFPAIQVLLERLHGSGLDWQLPYAANDVASLQLLTALAQADHHPAHALAQQLLEKAEQRGYNDYPVVPVHSDLNPHNCIHDTKRWWFIDWDFARMKAAAWDYAVLIVENGWGQIEARHLAPHIPLTDLAWFCANAALLSWDWHQQRGSEQVSHKWHMLTYWARLS